VPLPMKASRVTLDIDAGPSFALRARKAYHGLRDAADEVEVRVSSSGEGLHLVGWFSDRLDDDQKERLRRTLGDDAKRIDMDEMPTWRRERSVNNVLWAEKGTNDTAAISGEYDTLSDALAAVQMRAERDAEAHLQERLKMGLVR
jgi:hypothetical protein